MVFRCKLSGLYTEEELDPIAGESSSVYAIGSRRNVAAYYWLIVGGDREAAAGGGPCVRAEPGSAAVMGLLLHRGRGIEAPLEVHSERRSPEGRAFRRKQSSGLFSTNKPTETPE